MKLKILILISIFANTFSAFANEASSIRDYLPFREITAEASYIGAGSEIEAISNKLNTALETNSDWLDGYLKQIEHKPGQPIPYHPNLGLSKTEYSMLLKAKGKLQLVSLGTVKLTLSADEKMFKIKVIGGKLQKEFLVNVESNTIETSRARLTTVSSINQTSDNSPTGPWSGIQWSNISKEDEQLFSEKIAIGKLRKQNKGIIYYDLKSTKENIVTHFVILYPLSKIASAAD